MKDLRHIVAGLALLLAVAGPVVAQTGAPQAGGARQGRGQGRGGQVSAATMPIGTLDYLLTLKDDQKTKITEIQNKLKEDIKAAPAGDRAARTALNTKAASDIDVVLTDDQKTKLKDHMPTLRLIGQSRAIPMAVIPDLKLTAEQRTKIMTAAKETQEKMAALPRGQASQADRQALTATFKTTVEGILTDEQKKTIADKTPKAAPAPNP